MKIYLFYLRETHELYAHTITKEYAKKFSQQRNLRAFYRKTEDIDEYEYSAFLSKNHIRKLIEIPLEDSDGGYSVIGTEQEESFLVNAIENLEDQFIYLRNYLLSDNIFKKKYRDLLDKILVYYEIDHNHSVLKVNTLHLFYCLFRSTFSSYDDEKENKLFIGG